MSIAIARPDGPASPEPPATPTPTPTPTTATPRPLGTDTAQLGARPQQASLQTAAYAQGGPDVGRMSTVEKLQSSMNAGLGIAAKDAGNAALAALKDPKTVALVGAGVAAAVGVQFIPVVGEAVDVVAGVVVVAMYAAAGPEHRKEIGEALGELKAYFQTAHDAKTPHDLDVAAGHFAKFLEKGGKEGVDALLTVGGAVAAPAKFAKLLTEVKGLGSLSDVIRLGERGGAALGAVAGRAKELAGEAAGLLGRGATAVKEAILAAPGKIAEFGRTIGHTVDDAWNATSHFFGEVGDLFAGQHAVTPEGMRVPVPRSGPHDPNILLSQAHDPNNISAPVSGTSNAARSLVEGQELAALPFRERAVADARKLTEYALDPSSARGGDKARVFESALGYDKSNWQGLMQQIEAGVRTQPAVVGKADIYGQRFTVDIPVTGPNGKTATVRTGWILDSANAPDTPKLTTVYVK